MLKPDAAFGHLIDPGRMIGSTAISTNGFKSNIVRQDEDDVWFFGSWAVFLIHIDEGKGDDHAQNR